MYRSKKSVKHIWGPELVKYKMKAGRVNDFCLFVCLFWNLDLTLVFLSRGSESNQSADGRGCGLNRLKTNGKKLSGSYNIHPAF